MRRVLLGVAAGAVVALAAATGVSAYWQAQQTMTAGTVSAGNLDIDVAWDGGTTWPRIGPGQTIAKRATVDFVGSGDSLRAVLTGSTTQASAFDGYVTSDISLDDCTSDPGPSLPSNGYPDTGSLLPGDSVTVCVRYTMASDAPSSLQGQDLSPSATFTISQRTP